MVCKRVVAVRREKMEGDGVRGGGGGAREEILSV